MGLILIMFDLLPMLLLGFGLGLLHALDADHIMAMSVLNSDEPSVAKSLFFSAYWALGHTAMVFFVALLLVLFGIKISATWTSIAEIGVGLMLVLLGCGLLWTFKYEGLTLKKHSYADTVHRHWHDKGHAGAKSECAKNSVNAHKPIMVGLLHGFAGSAPAIALIPALAYAQISVSLLYLTAFSVGVMLAMFGFSLSFNYCHHVLSEKYQFFYQYNRQTIALMSIFVGGFWLAQAA